MIVVNSSVLIDWFDGTETPGSELLDEILGTETVMSGNLTPVEVLSNIPNDRKASWRQAPVGGFPVRLFIATSALSLGTARVSRGADSLFYHSAA